MNTLQVVSSVNTIGQKLKSSSSDMDTNKPDFEPQFAQTRINHLTEDEVKFKNAKGPNFRLVYGEDPLPHSLVEKYLK